MADNDLFGDSSSDDEVTTTKTNNIRHTALFTGDTDDEDEETKAERTKQHWQHVKILLELILWSATISTSIKRTNEITIDDKTNMSLERLCVEQKAYDDLCTNARETLPTMNIDDDTSFLDMDLDTDNEEDRKYLVHDLVKKKQLLTNKIQRYECLAHCDTDNIVPLVLEYLK